MKIHHLNCGIIKPVGSRFLGGFSFKMACHCLLIETDYGLVLADSGIGTADILDKSVMGAKRLYLDYGRSLNRTALLQVQKLGYKKEDVRHIILTHLDYDHAGGLPDFPEATVHVLKAEYDAAMSPAGMSEKNRYNRHHFSHNPRWMIHDRVSDEPWFGLTCITDLKGLPPGILLVPLTGHTKGHAGIAVLDDSSGWTLLAGDTYFQKGEMEEPPHSTTFIKFFNHLAHEDFNKAMASRNRLKNAVREAGGEIRVVSTHDPGEFPEEVRI